MCPWQSFIVGLCEHLAWPLVVIIFIACYRKDIKNILSRITKLPFGTELSQETVQEQKDSKDAYNRILAENKALKNEQSEIEERLRNINGGGK